MWVIYGVMLILATGLIAKLYLYITEPQEHTEEIVDSGYSTLIENIRKINPEAADWMEHGDKSMLTTFNQAGRLISCFDWSESPQGFDYWLNIRNHLPEAYYD